MTVLVNEETHVAIIGAGASGLAQLKQLIDAFSRPNVKSRLKVTVFEKRDQVGGVWYRQQGTKPYETSVGGDGQMYIYPPTGDDPSPMYDGLRTNLPYDLMSFRDLPMKSEEVFPDRETVQAYLEEYADTFDLRPKIRFRTSVTRLRQNPGPGRRWSLESRGPDGEEMVEEYDYVCVANGHYADPWIPNIPSLRSVRSYGIDLQIDELQLISRSDRPFQVLRSSRRLHRSNGHGGRILRLWIRPRTSAGQSQCLGGGYKWPSDYKRGVIAPKYQSLPVLFPNRQLLLSSTGTGRRTSTLARTFHECAPNLAP